MKIVSLNTAGGQIFDLLTIELARLDADVYCFQEVYRSPVPSYQFEQHADGTRILPNLFDVLEATLDGYTGYFYEYSSGSIATTKKSTQPLDKGLAMFVRKGMTVEAELKGFIFGQYRPEHVEGRMSPRNVQALRLALPGGDPVTIAHFHGVWRAGSKKDTPASRVQADRLMRFLRKHTSPEEKIVVCGDFNCLPDSLLLKELKSYGLTDLITKYRIDSTRTNFYKKSGPKYADYMTVSSAVNIISFDVPKEPEMSDHRCLILECT